MKKKILITGANSYIGISFENWLKQYPLDYQVDTIDMIGDGWKEKDFSEYDSVFHVAGIAHVKETPKNKDLFYRVNRDLAINVAQKAKEAGTKQFVFLSSMSVYGIESGSINLETIPNPKSHYGISKLQAELNIQKLSDSLFKVAIVRPPMIYGKGCKGNYSTLANFAQKLPLFPDIDNQRSMLYIENLCIFIKAIIDEQATGLIFPQNPEYVCTSQMLKSIAEAHNRKIAMVRFLNPLIKLFRHGIVNKVFGTLIYDRNISNYKVDCLIDFSTSIILTEQ